MLPSLMLALTTVWVQTANRESAQLDARGAEGMAFGMARAFSAVGAAPRIFKVQTSSVHAHAICLVVVPAAASPISPSVT